MNGVFNRSRMEKRGLNLCFFNKKTLIPNSSGDEFKPYITAQKPRRRESGTELEGACIQSQRYPQRTMKVFFSPTKKRSLGSYDKS